VITATVVAFPLMYKTAQGALNKSMLVFFGCPNSWGVGSNSILVILPLSWPGIVAGTVLSFARALGEFVPP